GVHLGRLAGGGSRADSKRPAVPDTGPQRQSERRTNHTGFPGGLRGTHRLFLDLKHCLDLHLDPDLVGYQHTARLQRLVPLESPLAPVDLGGATETYQLPATRVLSATLEHHVQHDFLHRVGDGQVTDYPETRALLGLRAEYFLADEAELRMFLRVEEIGCAQMTVSIARTRVDAGSLDTLLAA